MIIVDVTTVINTLYVFTHSVDQSINMSMKVNRTTPFEKLPQMMTLAEVSQWLGISRSTTYNRANRGDWLVVRCGRLIRVPKSALRK